MWNWSQIDIDASTWYVLLVKRNSEKAVANALTAKGLEVFLPMRRVRRQWSDRIKHIDFPLFPSYLFCRFKMRDNLLVRKTRGVCSIACTATAPLSIPTIEIDSLKRVCDSWLPSEVVKAPKPGQVIEITDDNGNSIAGTLVTTGVVCRVVIFFHTLQLGLALQVPREAVRIPE